jgi:phage shock protein A
MQNLSDTMSDAESIIALQSQVTHLERHITEQDAEFYRLTKRMDTLSQLIQVQKAQMNALISGGSGDASEMPANEKPPHY